MTTTLGVHAGSHEHTELVNRALVIGANRGIGLEMAKCFKARGDTVIAACRKAGDALPKLDVEIITDIDVADAASAGRLAKALGDRTVDVVVIAAGILKRVDLETFDEAAIREQLEVNALGPLRLARAVLPQVARGGKIAFLTSRMGSIGDNSSGSHYGYRMSKAALNAAGKSLAIDVRDRGISVVLLHPGFVRTDMTGGRGDVDAPESAARLVARIDALGIETTGSFVHADGSTLPW